MKRNQKESVCQTACKKLEEDARQFRTIQEAIKNLKMESTAGSYFQTRISDHLDRAIIALDQEAKDQIRELNA